MLEATVRNRCITFAALFCSLVLLAPIALAAIHKCEDPQGRVTFSSKPCSNDEKSTQVNPSSKPSNFISAPKQQVQPTTGKSGNFTRYELTDQNGVTREVSQAEFEVARRQNQRNARERQRQKETYDRDQAAIECAKQRSEYQDLRATCTRARCRERTQELRNFLVQKCGGV